MCVSSENIHVLSYIKEDNIMLYRPRDETLTSYMVCCWTKVIILRTKHDHVLHL